MKAVILVVFAFLSGMCLALLIVDKRPDVGSGQLPDVKTQRTHVFEVVWVEETPHWGPILADWGRTTLYCSSEEEFTRAFADLYATMIKGMAKHTP